MRRTASHHVGRLITLAPLVLLALPGVIVADPSPSFLHHHSHHYSGKVGPHDASKEPHHAHHDKPSILEKIHSIKEKLHEKLEKSHGSHAGPEAHHSTYETSHDTYPSHKAPEPEYPDSHAPQKIVIQLNNPEPYAATPATHSSGSVEYPPPPPHQHQQQQPPQTYEYEVPHTEIKEQRPRPRPRPRPRVHSGPARGKAKCSAPPRPPPPQPSPSQGPLVVELKVTGGRRSEGNSSDAESSLAVHRSYLLGAPGEELQSELPGVGLMRSAERSVKGKLNQASSVASALLKPTIDHVVLHAPSSG